MKKVVFISCTNHYKERTVYFENFFTSKGYSCTYITSNFNHNSKNFYKLDQPNTIQIPTLHYKRNLSFSRLYSHFKFSKDALKKVEEINPDILYVEIPPNSLSRQASKYKKKNPTTKLLLDVFDMWPETFPSSKMKKLLKLPFRIWGWFRNCGLDTADVVLSECQLFAESINNHLTGGKKSQVVYLCRENRPDVLPAFEYDDKALHLCYLGSINNIIDIPAICELLKNINAYKQTVLHIIGDGESRELFISSTKEAGTEVVFHGKIFGQAEKQKIFNKCSFGLNIMKDSVFIGLTMKSVDYFLGGLPIINSIKGDTWDLIDNKNIGFNIDKNSLPQLAKLIALTTNEQNTIQKENTLECFKNNFSFDVFLSNTESVLSKILD